MKERDYAEALKEYFDVENQSEEYGNNLTLSIEDGDCQYNNKYFNGISNESNVKM